MYMMNRLAKPGEIKSIRLSPETITVRLRNDKMIVYKRIESEDVSKGAECSLGKEFMFRRT